MATIARIALAVALAFACGCKLDVPQDVSWYAYATDDDAIAWQSGDAGNATGPEAKSYEGSSTVSAIVRTPLAAQNPLTDPLTAFMALTVEGPGITEGKYQIVEPYVPGKELQLSGVHNGPMRQLRIGLWPKNGNTGEPIGPLLALGRTIPFELSIAKAAQATGMFAYVTRVNEFAAAVGETGDTAAISARVGLTAVQMPDWSTMLLGGGIPKATATDPWDPNSYTSCQTKVLKYDANLRAMADMGAALNVGRAFHASAAGINGLVAVSGGYTFEDGAAKASKHMEFFDPASKKFLVSPNLAAAHMLYPRAHHTITRMFDNDDYFLIVGGKGPDPKAAFSWEIWHPKTGTQAQGQLKSPRWNHAAVRLPEGEGGYVMLIGGEGLEDGKPVALNNFEVIRYDTCGNVARVGKTAITCKMGGTNYCHPAGDPSGLGSDKCQGLKGQPGYQEITWEPIVQPLPDSVGRNLPGAVYVAHGAYHYVYIVGGFSDAARGKPLDRLDIFDIQQGIWVSNELTLDVARGAPLVAASMVGSRAGQVLIAGGIGPDGQTVAPAEAVYLANPGQPAAALQKWPVKTALPGGSVAGLAFPLATGHILLTGGASRNADGMSPQTTVLLWNPL